MKKAAAFLLVALVPCGCQTESGRERGEKAPLQNPAIAASIASDLSGDLVPFLPQGSVLSFETDGTERLSGALGDALVRAGYRMEGGDDRAGRTIALQVWSAQVEGDLLVRLSTPSHRLSKVYRQGGSQGDGRLEAVASGVVVPAGPLLVETISKEATSTGAAS
jgi:hypothetical protein